VTAGGTAGASLGSAAAVRRQTTVIARIFISSLNFVFVLLSLRDREKY
jgi:hypothetical protein